METDGLCAKHTFGESVVEMLLILCALHIFYSSHSMAILCSTHFGIFLSVQYCKICGGVHTGSESALVHTSLLKCQVVCHAHLSDWCGRYTWLVQLSVLGTHCKSTLFYRSVLCTQW